MMAKRGAGGESVMIKVNIPIKYNKQSLITTLLSSNVGKEEMQLTPGRPYPMHDRSFSSALSSLRKVFITESAMNKLSSSHHALNSLLFALDGYPTATEDPVEIEETARTGTVGGGTGSGRERRDWVPLTGDPLFPSGRLY